MKGKIKTLIVYVLIIVFILNAYRIFQNPYLNLILKNSYRDDVKYLSLYKNGRVRKTKKFESDNISVYIADAACFTPYIYNNKVLNKLNKIELKDSNGNIVDNNQDIEEIFKLAEKLEHDFSSFKIIEVKDKYFLSIGLNVNWESPYNFYEYDKVNKVLKDLHNFDGYEVEGLSLVE